MKKTILPHSFYQRADILTICKQLLGKWIFTQFDDSPLTGGMIIDVEAYAGPEDKASHAYNNRRTNRTETMFQAGGKCYVYTCYGIHSILNFITNQEGIPHGVMIRAIHPTHGIERMKARRNKEQLSLLGNGPGSVCQALGVTRALNSHDLTAAPLWVEDRGVMISDDNIIASPRINIDYAEEYVDVPWRFRVRELSSIDNELDRTL